MNYQHLTGPALALSLALAACTDPTAIGGALVDGTQLPLVYTDTIPLELTTELPIAGYVGFSQLSSAEFAPVGCFTSAATGTTNARLGLELIERSGRSFPAAAATIDSVVLVLPLQPGAQAGDVEAPVSLRVLRAEAGTIRQSESVTTTPLASTGVVYGETTVVPPRTRGPVTVYGADSSRVDTLAPQIRIRLDDTFRDDLVAALMRADTGATTEVRDTNFVAAFPGIIVEGAACGRTLPTVSFAGRDASQFGVSIYYTLDGRTRQYWLSPRQTQNGTYVAGYSQARLEVSRDRAGTPLERLLGGNSALGDSLAIVQSLDGTLVRVSFPDLSAFGARSGVTFAQLEVPVLTRADSTVAPLPGLVVQVANEAGDPTNYSAFIGATIYDPREGGSLVRIPDPRGGADSIQAYRFNVTTLFQSFVSGERDPEFFLVGAARSVLPGEVLLAGPRATPLRARLIVASAVLP